MNLLPPGKSSTGVEWITRSSPSSTRRAVSRIVSVSMPVSRHELLVLNIRSATSDYGQKHGVEALWTQDINGSR